MKTRATKQLALSLCLGLLCACGSTPPSDYYLLSVEAEGRVSDAASGPAIGIGPVTIPEYLRTPRIAVSEDPNRVDLSEYERWAEPLDKGMSRVLLLNLATLLDTQEVEIFPWRRNAKPEYALRVLVASLSVRENRAELICEWTITQPESGDLVRRSISRYDTPLAKPDAGNIAAAYSSLLLELSEDVAATIREHRPQGD